MIIVKHNIQEIIIPNNFNTKILKTIFSFLDNNTYTYS